MDRLLEMAKNPMAKKLWRSLHMPMRLPPVLRRATAAWDERPLDGRIAVVGATEGPLGAVLAEALLGAGATCYVAAQGAALEPWRDAADAYARPVTPLAGPEPAPGVRPDVMVLDLSDARDIAALDRLYHFFHPWVGELASNGRVIVLGHQASDADAAPVHVAARALDGFVRSIGKELGKTGITAHLIPVTAGAEAAVLPVLRFLASDRSSFLTLQPWAVGALCKGPQETPFVRPLEGKVILLTGAARGIGAATARALGREGAQVVCLDRPNDADPLAQVAREIGGRILAVDLADPAAPARIAADLEQHHGKLHGIVHNAGITRDKTLAKMDFDRWHQALDVNLGAVVRVTEALRPLLADDGRIVALSSVAGLSGNIGQTNYSASKAGVAGYVQALARELAHKRIGAVAVAPGFIETRLTMAIPVAMREVGRRMSALNQGGLPEDVAELVTFLCSPGAHGLSGQTVRICGGMLFGA